MSHKEAKKTECTTLHNTHLCRVKIKRATVNLEQSAFNAVNRNAFKKKKKSLQRMR